MSLDHLADHSRVWVYQSDRELSTDEVDVINHKARNFLSSWASHGKDLLAGIELRYKRFLIVAVDEQVAMASGCSIDKSVHFVKSLETEFNVDFFNRLIITYRSGTEVLACPMEEFSSKLANGELNEDSVVFNNLVSNVADLRDAWEVPVNHSWHKQLIPVS